MSTQPQHGKGSKPRPFSVKLDEFADNWNKIFEKKKDKKSKSSSVKDSQNPSSNK